MAQGGITRWAERGGWYDDGANNTTCTDSQ